MFSTLFEVLPSQTRKRRSARESTRRLEIELLEDRVTPSHLGGPLKGPPDHAVAAAHDNQNPGILPSQSNPHGKSYGEWGAEWWQWAGDTGFAPVVDETGEDAHLGQEGSVWFLAGNFGGVTERDVIIPTGQSLFFPLLNFAVSASPFFDPFFPDGITDDELRFIANQSMDVPGIELTLTINGKEMQNLEQYRADSPVFEFFGDNAVADGYWIMLAPLPPGEHTIHFSGFQPAFDLHLGDAEGTVIPFGDFSVEVTYNLTVAPPQGGLSTASTPANAGQGTGNGLGNPQGLSVQAQQQAMALAVLDGVFSEDGKPGKRK